MFYFVNNEGIIEKYQVNFDKDKIEKLKNDIIKNCSFIQHKEYESDYFPRFRDEIIVNFTYTPTGEEKEYFEETRDIYHFSYDQYQPPYLVDLINQLLNGNSKAIDEIFNYDTSTLNINDRIKIINDEFNEIPTDDIFKKKKKLNELEDLLKSKEINKNQQSIDVYYAQLLKLIKFNLIDSLPLCELVRINSFLEDKLSLKEVINVSKEKQFTKKLKK